MTEVILPQKEGIFLPLQLIKSILYVDISSHTAWIPIDKSKAGMDLLDGEKGKFGGAVTTLLHPQHDLLQYIYPSSQGSRSGDKT